MNREVEIGTNYRWSFLETRPVTAYVALHVTSWGMILELTERVTIKFNKKIFHIHMPFK